MLKILCLRHFKIICVKVQDLGNSYIKMPVLIIMSFKVVFCGPPPPSYPLSVLMIKNEKIMLFKAVFRDV